MLFFKLRHLVIFFPNIELHGEKITLNFTHPTEEIMLCKKKAQQTKFIKGMGSIRELTTMSID